MNGMNEAEKMRYLARLRSFMIRRQLGQIRPPARPMVDDANGHTRRDFLKGATAGAVALGAAGLGGSLLTGCGSSSSGETPSLPMPAGTRILMSTFLAGTVESIDPNTGAVQGDFFKKIDDDTTIAGVRRGPGNRVYVFSPGSNRFFICDATTGNVNRTVQLQVTQTPHCGAVGPDGNLYVVNAPSLNNRLGIGPDSVEIYTPDGDHIRTFISGNDTPEMRSPFGIAWGPDGNLYVTSVLAYLPFALGSDYVSKYDGTTGKFLGYVATNVKVPFNINFHPNGLLMVIEHFYSRVDLFDIKTGKIVDAFVGADFCLDVQYGPDNNVYLSSFTDQDGIASLFDNDTDAAEHKGRILRFNGGNGKAMGTIAEKLVFAGYLAFV